MYVDADELVEDFLDSFQFEVEPGDIWGDSENLYLVIQHEECGCIFLRAVTLVSSAEYQLIPQRDDEIKDYFLNSGFEKMGRIETCLEDLTYGRKHPVKVSTKKTKKTVKTKTSKKKKT